MKKTLIFLLLFTFIFEGCTPPMISILKSSKRELLYQYVKIEGSTYSVENEYDLDGLKKAVENSGNTYLQLELKDSSNCTFLKTTLKDSVLVCEDEKGSKEINLKDVKFINLYRATTKEEREKGWTQVIAWSLMGVLSDVASLYNGKKGFPATVIGVALGFGFGSLFFFKYNKQYEKIYCGQI